MAKQSYDERSQDYLDVVFDNNTSTFTLLLNSNPINFVDSVVELIFSLDGNVLDQSIYLDKQNYTEDEFNALIDGYFQNPEDAFDGIKFKLNKLENTDLIDWVMNQLI